MQAEAMIRAALKAVPTSYAYMDSLGWVFYKQGRFADAERELLKSIKEGSQNQPVILDHLGDTLWRLGRKQTAAQQWDLAQRVLERMRKSPGEELENDPELRDLHKPLQAKLRAVQDNKQPPIAELGKPQ